MSGIKNEDNVAAVLHGIMDIRIEPIPIPTIGENDVLLKMSSVGICGSDIKYWTHGSSGRFNLKDPMVLGHEASGTVVGVGSKVTDLKIGDRVAIEPGVPCRRCHVCRSGKYNLCPEVKFCATPPDHGNICKFFAHPADFCFKLPSNVSDDEGALMEPLAVALHTCRRGNVKAGDNILICGAGPVGILCMLVAKTMGVNKVAVTDIDDHRLKVVQDYGADHVINVSGMTEIGVALKAEEMLESKPEVVMECSGSDFSMRLGIHAAGQGGCVVQVGRGSPEPSIPLNIAATKEVDIRGVFRYANCYPAALQLIASGQLSGLRHLVTHHFPMQETVKAFETARSREARAIKVMIHCN